YRATPPATSEEEPTRREEEAAVLEVARISFGRRISWLLLPALASMMLLAVTNHVCQDVAVVPFFWVVPLALYLLSFIICFDRETWYRRGLFGVLAAVAIVAVSLLGLESEVESLLERIGEDGPAFCQALVEWILRQHETIYEQADKLAVEATGYMIMLFMVCMLCHGELARWKPPASRLTDFFLMVAAGGALGGIFVGLICPQIFSTNVEIHAGIIASFLLATGILWDAFWNTWLMRRLWRKCTVFGFVVLLLIVIIQAQFISITSDALVTVRNFYGVLTVNEYHRDEPDHILELLNGRILHGSQFQDTLVSRIPTTYYDDESGIGTTLLNFRRGEPLRVGVVGLGTGTVAAYGTAGDYYCFYEINPNVPRLANTYFTYLRNSRADVEIVLGDARLSMERQSPQDYDIITLDAFSGDAIPAHLLTKEAFEEYFRHLDPQGVVAVHVSNRDLDLVPVVGGIAKHFAIPVMIIESTDDGEVGEAGSDWMLMTRNEEFLQEPMVVGVAEEVQGTYTPIPLWTDQYSNLLEILN
ncbi:MAG: spermidine synthase, partial [Pirellulaceae bacterium]